MASDEKIRQCLLEEYKKTMAKNDWDEKRISASIEILEKRITAKRAAQLFQPPDQKEKPQASSTADKAKVFAPGMQR
jgi:hypothetical protein